MERRLKERLIGAAVLVMLAVIFIPMVLDDRTETDITITETNIPERPQDNFNSRIVPLDESDLTQLPEQVEDVIAEPVEEPETVIVENNADTPDELEMEAGSTEVVVPQPEKQPVQTPEAGSSKANQMGATAWVVQLGSFSSQDNATALNQKLRKAGYPAFVEPLKRQTGMAYRVRVGPELLRSDAQKMKEKLTREMQIEGMVIRYP